MRSDSGLTVWTIDHSTRPIGDVVSVLEAHHSETVADIRRFPGSRCLPQFGSDALATALAAHGIGYRWIEGFGGRRLADPTSPNDAWKREAFRGYADHTASEEFGLGLHELLTLAHASRTAILCAELVWWQSHPRLISDVLTSLGHEVRHIRDEGERRRGTSSRRRRG
jgi:uncharacterized protein (DUF488 family)